MLALASNTTPTEAGTSTLESEMISCAKPPSERWKSSFLRFCTGCPAESVTVTGIWMASTSTRIEAEGAAGRGGAAWTTATASRNIDVRTAEMVRMDWDDYTVAAPSRTRSERSKNGAGVGGRGKGAEGMAGVAFETRGAEGVSDRRRTEAQEQRSLKSQREALDKTAAGGFDDVLGNRGHQGFKPRIAGEENLGAHAFQRFRFLGHRAQRVERDDIARAF